MNEKAVKFEEHQLKIVQQGMLFLHKELGRDIISQSEEEIKDFEDVMEVLGLEKDKDFESLLPEYKRLFP